MLEKPWHDRVGNGLPRNRGEAGGFDAVWGQQTVILRWHERVYRKKLLPSKHSSAVHHLWANGHVSAVDRRPPQLRSWWRLLHKKTWQSLRALLLVLQWATTTRGRHSPPPPPPPPLEKRVSDTATSDVAMPPLLRILSHSSRAQYYWDRRTLWYSGCSCQFKRAQQSMHVHLAGHRRLSDQLAEKWSCHFSNAFCLVRCQLAFIQPRASRCQGGFSSASHRPPSPALIDHADVVFSDGHVGVRHACWTWLTFSQTFLTVFLLATPFRPSAGLDRGLRPHPYSPMRAWMIVTSLWNLPASRK